MFSRTKIACLVLLAALSCSHLLLAQKPNPVEEKLKGFVASSSEVAAIKQKEQVEIAQVTSANEYCKKENGGLILAVEDLVKVSNRAGARSKLITLIENGGSKRTLNLVQRPDGTLLEWSGSDLVAIDLSIRFGCLNENPPPGSKCHICRDFIDKCSRVGNATPAAKIDCILRALDGNCQECKDEHFNVLACLFGG